MKIFGKYLVFTAVLVACNAPMESKQEQENVENSVPVTVEAEDFLGSSAQEPTIVNKGSLVEMNGPGWLSYEVQIETAGRYRVEVIAATEKSVNVWLEDYIDNPDGRTYNVTGDIVVTSVSDFSTFGVEGTPLNNGTHQMKLHVREGSAKIDRVIFTLMKQHQLTPTVFKQSMEGSEWNLVWSDEFEDSTIDTSKWLFDIGNWGWGNYELQYYTENRVENARIDDGILIIEARKGDMDQKWTSARLTTRGKVSFLYGKIEFRAKVPRNKGNWAAGWTLGDSYVDELSWPYCGEIDILESVGYEVDDMTGDGIAHATVHTPAYYFKINNQISSVKDVKQIADTYHTYAVEWTPSEIRGYVDGEEYYLYDKNDNEKEWPFDKPQNIILNLAMGGGWGGAQGMDDSVSSQEFLIDYVRVYQR